MRLLANKDVKQFFLLMVTFLLLFIVVSQGVVYFLFQSFSLLLLFVSVLFACAILATCYWYLKKQDIIMEKAVTQIDSVISGNVDIRISCDEEGELYRLFHSVNTLAAICNAQLEKESKEKEDMRNTILDISHQLKTPLAALNIYNGILQEEAGEKEELQQYYTEFAEYEPYCRFQGCSHISEPDCGVKQALEQGKISRLRYENYVQLYEELKEKEKNRY